MTNMMSMMKKAAALQKDLERTHKELADKTVEFSSGGGMIKVVAAGDGSVRSIKIDPKAIDPAEPELLEDMVLAAVEGALKASRDMAQQEMAKLTSGLGLPGMPFM